MSRARAGTSVRAAAGYPGSGLNVYFATLKGLVADATSLAGADIVSTYGCGPADV
jgi:hypothetical protein